MTKTGNKRTYIGGTKSEARKKYFNYDKELTQIVTNLATSYGISPALVIDRLAHEGLIDRAIINNNLVANGNIVDVFGPSLFAESNNSTYNSSYGLLGLDTIYDTYSKGITKTKRPINIKKMTTRNESGEVVNSGNTKNLYDALELFTAELASRRNQVKQHYPNLTDTELDSATAARYNATNKYFKQLMDSGEYKYKYPIDVKGINIPTPTKTDSKYITNQNINVDFDETFRNAPYEDYVYKNNSYNPNLFLEDGYVANPNGVVEQTIMRNIINNNYTHPDKVSTYIDWYKYGGRRKAQLGLDIREGGIAIPIAPNMYYMKGRSHDEGGIGIGPNNKNGLEVEGGEVVKVGDRDIKVFSSVPLLRGVSPAQLVMEGANPTKVFNAQEEYKDRNRINDDGTRYEVGGEKIYTPSKSIQRQIQETGKITIGGAPTIGGLRTRGYISGLSAVRRFAKKGTNIFTRGIDNLDKKLQSLVNENKISTKTAQFANNMYKQFIGKYGENIPKTVSLAQDDNKKKYGGSMIYTINGNVKNGLSLRPKAEWGKGTSEKKVIDKDIRYLWTPEGFIFDNGQSAIRIGNEAIMNHSPEFVNIAINRQTNKRPQYYAEKRLPIAGSQSIAEKAGLARSGWSYADNTTLDYVPNVSLAIPENYGKGVASSTPRGRGTKATTSRATTKSQPTLQDTVNKITTDAWKAANTPKIDLSKAKMPTFDVSQLGTKETKAAKAKLNESSTGGGTQPKDAPWIGQYKTTNVGDWIGLGSNLLGSVASYFMTKNAINKMPDPVKPIVAQAAKLKTKYNIEPQLSEIREAEQMNRAAVRRNTQSSNTSLAREQRLMNEARGARNQLYGQKENIETQLINQDRLNRQSVNMQNVRAYNEYLNRLTATRQGQAQMRAANINNLISGLTGGVNNILSTIDSRRATNNTLRAIAAANPNVDARLIGGFDYYIDPITKKKYNKNQQYIGTING